MRARNTEQAQDIGQRLRERRVETTCLGFDLLRPATVVVLLGDPEIAFEKLDHRQPGRSLAVRDRVRLQYFASVRDRGLELVHQARLARARLANCRDDLPVSRRGVLQRAGYRRHLALAPDEPRQPAPR